MLLKHQRVRLAINDRHQFIEHQKLVENKLMMTKKKIMNIVLLHDLEENVEIQL
jgi:hypothetical protein